MLEHLPWSVKKMLNFIWPLQSFWGKNNLIENGQFKNKNSNTETFSNLPLFTKGLYHKTYYRRNLQFS